LNKLKNGFIILAVLLVAAVFFAKNQLIKFAYKIKNDTSIQYEDNQYEIKGYTLISANLKQGVIAIVDDADNRNEIIILEVTPPFSDLKEAIKYNEVNVKRKLKKGCLLLTFNQKERAHLEMVFVVKNDLSFSFKQDTFNKDSLLKMCTAVNISSTGAS
jgi:hypothetical protein